MKIKFNIDKVILFILAILIFLPCSINIVGISLTKIISVLVGIIFIYFLIKKRMELKKLIKNKFIILNFIFCFTIFLSLIANFKNMKFNDFYEIAKYVVLSMIMAIILSTCKQKENYSFLLKTVSIIMIIVSIFGIIQYFNPFSINELYINSYAPTQSTTLVGDYPTPRIVGTKSNPAVYGLLMSLGVFFNILYIKNSEKKGLGIASIILCIINLMLTLTRTIQIAFICAIIIYVLINVWIKKGWKKALIAMGIAIISFIILLCILPSSITWRLMQVLDLSNVTSWLNRTEKWANYLPIISQNLILGIGPVKNSFSTIGYVDSELIQIVLQYGIVGATAYIGMLLSPLYIYIKNKSYHKIIEYYPSLLILVIINNISNTSFMQFDTAIGIYIFISLLMVNSTNCQDEKKEKTFNNKENNKIVGKNKN